MSDYISEILGDAPTPENTAVFSMQLEQLDRHLRKLSKKKKGKKGKGKKKLKKQVRALEQKLQQFKKLEKKYRKKNKGRKGKKKLKKQAREWGYQRPWWQDAVTASLPKALELANTYMSRLPPKEQPPLALPEHRD